MQTMIRYRWYFVGCADDNSHIRLMMAVAQKLSQPDIKEKMLAAKEIEELWTLMQDRMDGVKNIK